MGSIGLCLEAEILAALKVHDPTQYALLARRRRAVETVMAEEIDPLVQARYAQIARMLDDALMRLARTEVQAVQSIVNSVTEEETIAACLPNASCGLASCTGFFLQRRSRQT